MNKGGPIIKEMRRQADKRKASVLKRFFKTGPGEYGEGDIFLGLTVPQVRAIAKRYDDTGLDEIKDLLGSRVHEERLMGLLMLVSKFRRGDAPMREKIYRFYLANTRSINNWDLVDLTAANIIGAFLDGCKDVSVLHDLAASKDVWERRISVIATFHFIKNGFADHTFAVSEKLLQDDHDLIHKAVGWMLREVGKRIGLEEEESFLKKHYNVMPRTMLRYAIERFPEKKRQAYLKGEVK